MVLVAIVGVVHDKTFDAGVYLRGRAYVVDAGEHAALPPASHGEFARQEFARAPTKSI